MLKDRITPNLMVAFTKATIVLLPSYFAAYLTDKMVYVVPTLAAAGMFAATVEQRDVNRLLDEDGDSESDLADE